MAKLEGEQEYIDLKWSILDGAGEEVRLKHYESFLPNNPVPSSCITTCLF